MALKRNMTRDEIASFIDDELIPQVNLEIGNWIHPVKKQGGYFVVTRQILCMVEFLGAVYSGYSKTEKNIDKDDRRGRERIATTKKAKEFIAKFFEPHNSYQASAIDYLYDMYRHGLVHLYQPRILRYNSRRSLKWFFYRGKNRYYKKLSIDTPEGKKIFRDVEYLQVLKNKGLRDYYFPIGIDCLYDDFAMAVKSYKNELRNNKSLQRKWRTAVNAICKPKELQKLTN